MTTVLLIKSPESVTNDFPDFGDSYQILKQRESWDVWSDLTHSHKVYNSSEAKASRVIIVRFPEKSVSGL